MLKKIAAIVFVAALSGGAVMAGKTLKQDAAASGDKGRMPWVADIEKLTLENDNFRSAKWTGRHLQLTVMAIKPGGEIGLEKHDKNDQFIRVEKGSARVLMGLKKDKMTFDEKVADDWMIMIPAGYWHNVVNIGEEELKVYALYSPPEHKPGTLHKTFEESEADHHH